VCGDRINRILLNARGHATLFDLAARATENGCFGLDLAAKEGDRRDNGLLAYTPLSSGTFGEALKVVERYFHVLNEAIDVKVEFSPREVTIDYQLSDARLTTPRQAIEFGAANLVRSLQFLTNSRLRPGEVKFRHSRNHEPQSSRGSLAVPFISAPGTIH
jgi:hypothetical protein